MALLNHTANWAKSKECMIERWYSDETGKYAFRTRIHDQAFFVAARSYTKGSNTSFMKSLLRRAEDAEALILLRIGSPDIERMLVFDPGAILEHGELNTAEQKRQQRGEEWLDIPTSWAASFFDYMSEYDTPQTEPDDPTQQTSL